MKVIIQIIILILTLHTYSQDNDLTLDTSLKKMQNSASIINLAPKNNYAWNTSIPQGEVCGAGLIQITESPESICSKVRNATSRNSAKKTLTDSGVEVCLSIDNEMLERFRNSAQGKEECIKIVKDQKQANDYTNAAVANIGALGSTLAQKMKDQPDPIEDNAMMSYTDPETGETIYELKPLVVKSTSLECKKFEQCVKSNILLDKNINEIKSLNIVSLLSSYNSKLQLPNNDSACECAGNAINRLADSLNLDSSVDFKNAIKKLNLYIAKDRLKLKPQEKLESLFEEIAASGASLPKSCIDLYEKVTGTSASAAYEKAKYYTPCEGVKVSRTDFYKKKNDFALRPINKPLRKLSKNLQRGILLSNKAKKLPKNCRSFFDYSMKNLNQLLNKNPNKLTESCKKETIIIELEQFRQQANLQNILTSNIQAQNKNPIYKQLLFTDFNDLGKILKQHNRNKNIGPINRVKAMRKLETPEGSSKLADISCKQYEKELSNIESDLVKEKPHQFIKSIKLDRNQIDYNIKTTPLASISENQILSSVRRFFNDSKSAKSLEDVRLKNILYSRMSPAYCGLQDKAKEKKQPFESMHSFLEDEFAITDENRKGQKGSFSSIKDYGDKLCKGEENPSVISRLSDKAQSCVLYENCSRLKSGEIFRATDEYIKTGSEQSISDLEKKIEKVYPNSVPAPNVYDPTSFNQERSYSQSIQPKKSTRSVSEISQAQQKIKNNSDHINELSSRKTYLAKNPEDSTIADEILILEKEIERLKEENRHLARNQRTQQKDYDDNIVDSSLNNNYFTGSSPRRASSLKSKSEQANSTPLSNAKRSLSSYQPTNVTKARKQEISDNFRGRVEGNIPVGYPPQINVEISAIVKTPQQLIANLDLIAQADQKALRSILKAALSSEDIYFNNEMIHFDKDDYPQIVKLISQKLKLQQKEIKQDENQIVEDQTLQAEVKYYDSLKFASEQVGDSF